MILLSTLPVLCLVHILTSHESPHKPQQLLGAAVLKYTRFTFNVQQCCMLTNPAGENVDTFACRCVGGNVA